MTDDLIKLAEGVEALTGPCRETDALIMAALFVREDRHIGTREGWDDESWADCIPVKDAVWVDPATDKWVSTHARRFTASLDDALTLVPEGVQEWHAGKHMKGGGSAYILMTKVLRDPIYVVAATPALALTAAALRARGAEHAG